MKDKQQQLKFYERMGFDDEQLDEIKKGIEDGLDISVYARKDMPAKEMAHIRKSMNFKKSLNSVVNERNDIDTSSNEEEIEVRTKEESIAEMAIVLGEASIVIAVIAILLSLQRII